MATTRQSRTAQTAQSCKPRSPSQHSHIHALELGHLITFKHSLQPLLRQNSSHDNYCTDIHVLRNLSPGAAVAFSWFWCQIRNCRLIYFYKSISSSYSTGFI